MSENNVGRLWDKLNNVTLFPTPQSTVDAIMYCVRERGLAALDEPNNLERLARCDQAAREQIKKRIDTLIEKGMLK
jgi:hypothetical protein